jgi:hypothetical protein
VLLNVSDRKDFVKLLESYKFPCTVSVKRGKDRTLDQNRLVFMWLNEAADQLGDHTPEELRGYCKLHFGVPILRAADNDFRAAYDRVIRPLDYESKLACMMVPLDFPVTRLMSTKHLTEYLDRMRQHFEEHGVTLTDPERG